MPKPELCEYMEPIHTSDPRIITAGCEIRNDGSCIDPSLDRSNCPWQIM